jgi:hypothetical protein
VAPSSASPRSPLPLQRRPHSPPTPLEQCSRCWEIPFVVGTNFATHEDESARFDHWSRVEAEQRNRRSYQKESSILPCLPCNHSMTIQRSNSDGRHQIHGSDAHSCVCQISNPRVCLLSFGMHSHTTRFGTARSKDNHGGIGIEDNKGNWPPGRRTKE